MIGNPVVALVDAFVGSNESPVAADMVVPLLARFVKLGRLDAVDMDVVVAVIPPPRPKPAPVAMVVGVPKVRPVSAAIPKLTRVKILGVISQIGKSAKKCFTFVQKTFVPVVGFRVPKDSPVFGGVAIVCFEFTPTCFDRVSPPNLTVKQELRLYEQSRTNRTDAKEVVVRVVLVVVVRAQQSSE